MKRKIVGILVMMLVTIITLSHVSACTSFTSSNDENTLVGANFDWSADFNIYMQVFPAKEGKFGRIFFEFPFALDINPDYFVPRQGMNDQGLFYAIHISPYLLPVNSSDKPIFYSEDPEYYQVALYAYCLAKCSTVNEVVEVFDQYNLEGLCDTQCFFVDRNGDSVIIEGDDIIYKEGDFQVLTNFYHSHPELGYYPCGRYDAAVDMLENMDELNDDYFRSICDATHQSHTVHSNIYDLNQGIIYINYNNNFERTVEIDIDEELAKGESRIFLGSLFDSEDNNPPEKPESPTGEASGEPGVDYEFKGKETDDPDGDRTMYLFDWGDGTESAWLTPGMFGGTFKATHNWTERGNYEVKIKGKDVYGRESEWSDPLSVTMPRNKVINRPFLSFLENHPRMFPLLRQLLGL